MNRTKSIAQARSDLPSLVREAESGGTVELTRRGNPVAVLIGHREYRRLTTAGRSFAESYERFTQEFPLRELAIDPDAVFGRVRDETSGRKVDL